MDQGLSGLGVRNDPIKVHGYAGMETVWRPTRMSGYVGGMVRTIVPLWIPTIAFAFYPTVAFIRGPLRRWRRRRKGLCAKCGYNLTGNESGSCPECGQQVES
ncbi:MAG: hypothetical protein IH991_11960 [Planctomycetes bacterium]|nr:hypothetical protein [Planctomycetota bacterium]